MDSENSITIAGLMEKSENSTKLLSELTEEDVWSAADHEESDEGHGHMMKRNGGAEQGRVRRRWLRESGGLSRALEDARIRSRDPRNSGQNIIHPKSKPVNVPKWDKIGGNDYDGNNGEINGGVDDEDDGGERLPPHEYLARARGQTTTPSVYEGVGRTLKGRDLSRVRNAVWRHTGFTG
eukprot:Gb_36660 [translate_table: standard]